MTNRPRRLVPALLVLALLPSCTQTRPKPCAGVETRESILARIKAPTFPRKDFPITTYGAKADADNSEAIRLAIQACNAAGGGRVIIPGGTWLTGPVHLKSNVNLHLADNATLKFIPEPAKYPLVLTRWEGVECLNYSPLIYAYQQTNIAVTGEGSATLDGSATMDNWLAWSKRPAGAANSVPVIQRESRDRLNAMGQAGTPVDQRVMGPNGKLRPNFIQPYLCKNVLLSNFKLINSPMWCTNPVLCTNVTVRNLTIESHGANNDGCDPDSCSDVLIENCTFITGDDCIAIKSGRNNDGRRVNVPAQNIVIQNCTMRDGHGGVTIGSEISGSCRNVFVQNCTMDSPHLNQAIRFKSNAQRGGTIENVHVSNVSIGTVGVSALSIEFTYEEGANGPHKPVLRNVHLNNITTQSCGKVIHLSSFPAATVENITISNSTFKGVKNPNLIKDAAAPTLINTTTDLP